MKPSIILYSYLLMVLIHPALGDTLQLCKGTSIEDGLVGVDGKTLTFTTTTGVKPFARTDVKTIFFAAPEQALTSPPPTVGYTVPASGTFSFPAGTLLIVSMSSPVSSDETSGRRFTAKLEADLVSGSTAIIPTAAMLEFSLTQPLTVTL